METTATNKKTGTLKQPDKPANDSLPIDVSQTITEAVEFVHNNMRVKPQESWHMAEKALALAQANSQKFPLAQLYYYRGWLNLDADNAQDSIADFQRSLELFDGLHETEWTIKCMSSLGFAETSIGNVAKSFEYYERALKLAKGLSDEKYVGQVHSNMGESFLVLKQYEEALNNFKSGLKYAHFIPNKVISLERIGYVYTQIDKTKKGIPYLEAGLALAKKENLPTIQLQIAKSLGSAYINLGNTEKAIETLHETIQEAKDHKLERIAADASLVLGNYLLELKREEEAKILFIDALSISTRNNIIPTKVEALRGISEILQREGKLGEALKAYKKYHAENQNFFSEETNKQIERMRFSESAREVELFKKMYSQLSLISQIGKQITSTLDLREIVYTIYKELNKIMDLALLGLGLYDEKKQEINYRFFIENDKWLPSSKISLTNENSFGAWCIKNKKEVIINDVKKEYKDYIKNMHLLDDSPEKQTESLIYLPLFIGNKVTGILSLQSHNKNAYDDYKVETFKSLASYVAIAVENAKLYEEVEHLATIDPLTGLANRAHFNSYAEKEFAKYKRNHNEFSIIMFDLDYFKKINDTYGHEIGDLVLKDVAHFFSQKIRNIDLFCRWGGEEFIIILPNTKLQQATILASRLKKDLSNHKISISMGQEVTITASFGVTSVKPGDKNVSKVIKRADLATYEAKEQGRNTVSINF